MEGAESIRFIDTYPLIHEKTAITTLDHHYFYQDIWAAKRIYQDKPSDHIDVGSLIEYVGFLTTFTRVVFVDIRPLRAKVEGLRFLKGDILSMPFEDNSVPSLSCLHVAEHIGLGRYGDQLDPQGTKKAAVELSRVLSPGGNLYFSLPLGKPKLCFNAHRIHSPDMILEYFKDLELVELSGVTDQGAFQENIDIDVLRGCDYGCGLFWFKKPRVTVP